MAMLQKSLLPFAVELKSMIFKNAQCNIVDEYYKSEIFLFFNSYQIRVSLKKKMFALWDMIS